ncbi:hypothetical protein LINPERHAP2_LOCUS29689 [Linum perenne]
MEQRNFEIAIEVSELEVTISGLRQELEGKTTLIGKLEKTTAEKESMASEIERGMWEKAKLEDRLRNSETKMECLKPLLVDQLTKTWKIHDQLFDAMKIVDKNYQQSDRRTEEGERERGTTAAMVRERERGRRLAWCVAVGEEEREWGRENIIIVFFK